MKNSNVFMARKRPRNKAKSGTLPIGAHAPKPKRAFKEHQNLSRKGRKNQSSAAKARQRGA